MYYAITLDSRLWFPLNCTDNATAETIEHKTPPS